jgi:hypothetical protein
MDCLTAEPFVSILYDGEPVPADALAHITACLSCQTRLQDYAVISGRMHTLAAMERAGTPPLEAPPHPGDRRPVWPHPWNASISIPHVLAAAFALLFLVTSAGWLRATAARPKPVLKLKLEMRTTRDRKPD